ncbi:hypothetical protein [Arthrobacter sp.]|uniref:hypothetical protein n=1 Tax=Arthrobacter sp. TaxID=1667 RepID=UPI0026E0A1AE|nr:hypothetical protein [Arthrobacter sp.]MDO5754165.1 hypothetical protein [Arthrobacter sp.]
MLATEKSAMGEKGQIQFGTVFGGNAKVAVLAVLPGAFALAFSLDELLFSEPPDEHAVAAKNTAATIPTNRMNGFRFLSCDRKYSMLPSMSKPCGGDRFGLRKAPNSRL